MRRPTPGPGWQTNLVPAVLLALSVLNVGWAWAGYRYGRHWYRFLFRSRARGIVLHHTASDGWRDGKLLDAAAIDRDHAARNFGLKYHGRVYHIGYHYVILADGTVQPGRPEEAPGAHTTGHNDYLGICLVGSFSSVGDPDGRLQPARPTEKQLTALIALVRRLMDKYDFEVSDIYRHRDLDQTECPGDRFPFQQVIEELGGTGNPRSSVDSRR